MKKVLLMLLIISMIMTSFALITPVSAAEVIPDVLLTGDQLFEANNWIKKGVS